MGGVGGGGDRGGVGICWWSLRLGEVGGGLFLLGGLRLVAPAEVLHPPAEASTISFSDFADSTWSGNIGTRGAGTSGVGAVPGIGV
jgi:hypothetical protein